MKTLYYSVFVTLWLVGCSVDIGEDGMTNCLQRIDEQNISTIANHLGSRGIKFERRSPIKICYNKKDWLEFDRAEALANEHKHSVATIINTKQQEQEVVMLLATSSKGYQITNMEDGRRFLVIYSNSEKEVKENRDILKHIESQ